MGEPGGLKLTIEKSDFNEDPVVNNFDARALPERCSADEIAFTVHMFLPRTYGKALTSYTCMV